MIPNVMAGTDAGCSLASNILTAGGNIMIHDSRHINHQQNPKPSIEIYTALGALHDSAGRYEAPRCYPETRTTVLENIVQWSQASDSQPIMWLRGAAGAGKTAIAQTLADRWHKEKILAAAFFFSRTIPKCNEKTYFVATLAYQLQLNIPSTHSHIHAAVSRDFGIFTKNMEVQMTELVIKPLEAVCGTFQRPPTRVLIIIDGLDECSIEVGDQNHEAQHREILGAISLAARTHLPIRFLIVSRPERQIRESFGRNPLKGLGTEIDLSKAVHSSRDIRIFLHGRFVEIKQDTGIQDPTWPSEDDIMCLVQKASSHFIYASIAVRYIARPRSNPRQSLKQLLDLDTRKQSTQNPFSELDKLYTLILRSVSPTSLAMVNAILSSICFEDKISNEATMEWSGIQIWQLFTDHTGPSIKFFERFYRLSPGDLNVHLTDLHSILRIPSSDDESDPLRFMHASFSDFLTDKSRSGEFFLHKQNYLLLRQTQLTKHMMIYLLNVGHPSVSAIPYNRLVLSDSFAMILNRNLTPSPELIKGLEILDIGDEKRCRDYLGIIEQNDYSTPQLELPLHQLPPLGKRSFLRCVLKEYLKVSRFDPAVVTLFEYNKT